MSRSLVTRTTRFVVVTAVAAGALALPGTPASAEFPTLAIQGTTRVGANMFVDEGSATPEDPAKASIKGDFASTIGPHESSRWKIEATRAYNSGPMNVQINLTYRLNRHDTGTEYWLKAYFQTPRTGRNSGGCVFVKKATDTFEQRVHDAPFTCRWLNFDPNEWTPEPVLDIKSTG